MPPQQSAALPLYRQEERFAHAGFRIDRGTLCRWMEELGLTVGATVVHAMREEALRTAFCIATDATGVLVQPIRGGDKQRAEADERTLHAIARARRRWWIWLLADSVVFVFALALTLVVAK